MLKASYTKQFQRDLKRIRKRDKDIGKLKIVVTMLCAEKTLPPKYRNHKLLGNYVGSMECHLEPDWLLIYPFEERGILFETTGSHSDLFK